MDQWSGHSIRKLYFCKRYETEAFHKYFSIIHLKYIVNACQLSILACHAVHSTRPYCYLVPTLRCSLITWDGLSLCGNVSYIGRVLPDQTKVHLVKCLVSNSGHPGAAKKCRHLHCLLVCLQAQFKVMALAYKAIYRLGMGYQKNLQRSSSKALLHVTISLEVRRVTTRDRFSALMS